MKRVGGAWPYRMQLPSTGRVHRLLLPTPLALPALCARVGSCIREGGCSLTYRDIGLSTDAQRDSEMQTQRGPEDTNRQTETHTLTSSPCTGSCAQTSQATLTPAPRLSYKCPCGPGTWSHMWLLRKPVTSLWHPDPLVSSHLYFPHGCR